MTKGDVPPCAYCREWPVNFPHAYCSKECGIRDRIRKDAAEVKPLQEFSEESRDFASGEFSLSVWILGYDLTSKSDPWVVASRFADRWDDRERKLQTPGIRTIFQINLPKKYEDRFTNAV